MHRASVGRRAPANGLDRPSSHAVTHGILTKSTSPTSARSPRRRIDDVEIDGSRRRHAEAREHVGKLFIHRRAQVTGDSVQIPPQRIEFVSFPHQEPTVQCIL